MDKFECLACGPVPSRDPYSPFCAACGGPLFVVAARRESGKRIHEDRPLALEKFADFLPLDRVDRALSLGEGLTPLIRLGRAVASLGASEVYAKNEAQNPTGSFKDRGTAVAVQKAVSLGFRRVGTVSTGNMAASTAAYGARAGLETVVLLKEGTSAAGLRAAAVHGPRLVSVDGDYGELFHVSLAVGKALGIPFLNSIDPYRMEGYKLTAFEIYLQLGRRAPGLVVVPLSSGGHLLGLMRAFEELERDGMIAAYPLFVGVQAQGCAPLVQAFDAGLDTYTRWPEVRTIAHAISNPAPPAGNAVLRMVRDRRGVLVAVTDEDMLDAQRDLAEQEGLSCQPESATTLAALRKMAAVGGRPDREGPAVLILTGSGLKAAARTAKAGAVEHRLGLADLEAGLRRLLSPEV